MIEKYKKMGMKKCIKELFLIPLTDIIPRGFASRSKKYLNGFEGN